MIDKRRSDSDYASVGTWLPWVKATFTDLSSNLFENRFGLWLRGNHVPTLSKSHMSTAICVLVREKSLPSAPENRRESLRIPENRYSHELEKDYTPQ